MNTNNKISYKPLKSKTIKKELFINGGDLDLYLDITLKDSEGNVKETLTKKADSILANFLRILYLQMSRDARDNVMGGTFYTYQVSFDGTQLSSITSGTGGVFRLNSGSNIFYYAAATGKITLGGFQGIALDGRYNYTKISNSIIEIDGTTYTAGWTPGTGGGFIYHPITNIGSPSHQSFTNGGIIIGTGNAPVTIDDQLLEKQVPNGSANGSLNYSSTIVSQDTSDATSAQITITRTFTNNATTVVPVREIGFLQSAGTPNFPLLTMRDILPNAVNVGNGNTLTVNYRIKTVLGTGTDPGGFLVSFMRLLYRHIAQTSRAAFDINNISRTHTASHPTFCAVRNGGLNIPNSTNGESEYGYKFGIVIGTGDTAVSINDYYLANPIVHGEGTNQMLYYGGFAQGFNLASNYAEFNIYKAIENNSGSTIQVKEYALTVASCATNSLTNNDREYNYLYTITRNTLTTPINVANGEILKVIYTIRCVVGGGSS